MSRRFATSLLRPAGPLLVVLLAGCLGDAEGTWDDEALPVDEASLASTSQAPLHAARVTVGDGGVRQVFAYPAQSCSPRWGTEWGDRPDMAARAFIDEQGKIQFYSGYFDMYRMEGSSLQSLSRKCDAPVQVSPDNGDYQLHRSREWLQAFYTRDGRNVAAIASVDWNGYWYSSEPRCKDLDAEVPGNIACWWNKLTAFRSTNGGRSFQTSTGAFANSPLAVPPGNPTGQNADQGGRVGFFHVTNILKDPKTGHYFFFTLANGSKKNNVNQQRNGLCLMRAWSTADLGNPRSWHAWAGGSAVSSPGAGEACTPIAVPPGLGGARFLGYSTFYQKYILLSGGTDGRGLWFALSDRLDQWPSESYLVPFYPNKTLLYLTLIDPEYPALAASLDEPESARRERRNFDVVGQRPSLYFVEKSDAGYPVLKQVTLEFTR